MSAEDAPRRGQVRLGHLFGVPVYLSWNWLIIAVFVVVMFGPQVARLFPELGIGAYGVAFLYAVLLALSVLVHELAHALSARLFDWPAQEIVLNLWGGHTQFAAFDATPGRSLITAMAGPVSNVVLALGGHLLLAVADPGGVARLLLEILIYANWLVAIFNALPGLPLDGGRIVESAVWKITGSHDRGTLAAGWAGRIIVVGLGVVLIVVPFLQGRTANIPIIALFVLVGFTLWSGATDAIRGAQLRLRVPSLWASELMVPAVGMPATSSVAEVLRAPAGHEVVLESEARYPEAVVDPVAVASVPMELTAQTSAAAVARALAPGAVIRHSEHGQALVSYLARIEGAEYAVLGPDGRVCGLLRQAEVMAHLEQKPTARDRSGR